ncbi:uncharacterized protein LOC111383240 [Olea europaea var. sylvestris]|uniref:uncharacterized protein LOC111383240 n=1 Tax=Olea europaea var. sylvestris TaxID=158386 RepID=UPI000C1D6ED1|nr:uncharacterized protein LOC111383240 [Olea europaea var. sylvestris]
MPSYTKFLKDILSDKCKVRGHETIMLTEECSMRIQKKLLPKLKSFPEIIESLNSVTPGKLLQISVTSWKSSRSFTVPCTIGEVYFDKALCNLGISMNLMPLSVFRKLGLGVAKATTVTL